MSKAQNKLNYEKKNSKDFFYSSNNYFPNYNMIEDKCQSIAKDHAEKLGKLVKHYLNENKAVIKHGEQRNFSIYNEFVQFVFEMHINFLKNSCKSFLALNCCVYEDSKSDMKRIKMNQVRSRKSSSPTSEHLEHKDLENLNCPVDCNTDSVPIDYEEISQQQKATAYRKHSMEENIFHEEDIYKNISSKNSKNMFRSIRTNDKLFYPSNYESKLENNKTLNERKQ